jgi:hypothetical protein
MTQNAIVRTALHWLPAIMLVFAFGHWPYGYYMLLRVVVSVTAILLAFDTYRSANEMTLWCATFAAIVIVFNPLFPLHLTRGVWGVLDLAAAALFAGHFFISRADVEDTSTP